MRALNESMLPVKIDFRRKVFESKLCRYACGLLDFLVSVKVGKSSFFFVFAFYVV